MNNVVKFLLGYSISIIATIVSAVFMILSAVNIFPSGQKALLFAALAFLPLAIDIVIGFLRNASIVEKVKTFIATVGPAGILYFLVWLLSKYLKKEFMGNVARIAAIVLVAIIVFDLIYYIKKFKISAGMDVIKDSAASPIIKLMYRLSYYLCRGSVVLGYLLTSFIEAEFVYIAIFGCVLWVFNKLLTYYCYALFKARGVEEYERNGGNVESSTDTDASANSGASSNSSGERPANDHDVYKLTKAIADRWTGKEDTSLLLSGSGYIRYDVSVELNGYGGINYTINGKLRGVNENYINEARIHLGSQMDKAALKIAEETRRELEKLNLTTSYDINVRKGYID